MIVRDRKTPVWRMLIPFVLLTCGAMPRSQVLAAPPDAVDATPGGGNAPVAVADFPIWIDLDKPQLVTVVIEDASGVRVRNLVAEMQLPAGRNRLSWDGYDDGIYETPFVQRHNQKPVGDLVRKRVPPGTYRARGLTQDGIKVVYEFTVYSGGNPPWPNKDNTGAWLADHSCPLGAVFLPAGSGSPYGNGAPQVLLTALIGEAGAPFVWAGLDGQTLQRRQMWGWDGAIAAARDAGRAADPDIYAYLVMAWKDSIAIRGLKRDGGKADIVSFKIRQVQPTGRPAEFFTDNENEPRHLGYSLAVHDGLLVFNAVADELLVFADVKTRKVLGTVPMPRPIALQFDAAGRLLVASEGKILRFNVTRPKLAADAAAGTPELTQRTVLIEKGLENPRTLAFNPAGSELFVADWGQSNQVKVFTPGGKLLRTIGKPSAGAQLGLYDELKMQAPLGLAIDDQNQLWVVEAAHLPKRVSLWNATTGTFLRAHYGPPKYGGGGHIDPTDKTRMFYWDYYGLIEFALDWKTGTAKPKAICVNAANKKGSIVDAYGIEYGNDKVGGNSRWGFVGESPVTINGRTYFTGSVIWMLGDDHIAWPVGRVGGDSFAWPPQLNQNLVSVRPKTNPSQQLIAWSDRNGNHKVDADEYGFRDMPGTYSDEAGKPQQIGGFVQESYFPDLSMTANWGLHVPAPSFDSKGIPTWDISKAKFILPPQPMFRYGESDPHWGTGVWPLSDGWVVSKGGWGGWRDGKRLWTYPVLGADSPPMVGGVVVHPRGMIGLANAASGEAGYWYAVNGEKGNIFLMTSDGLFLQTLGGDMRNTPLLRYPMADRGMVVDAPGQHRSFEDEHYNPSITQTNAGETYLVAGKEHSSIFRLDGFASVKRREFGQLALDTASLASLPEVKVIAARKQASNTLHVEVGGPEPVVDGKVAEYSQWASLGADRQASVRIGASHLYAAWQTGDKDCMVNGGGDFKYLFKRGGCVDLMIQTDVAAERPTSDPLPLDVRLLVTTVKGETKAVLYRAVVPGTAQKDRVLFESPVGSVWFDAVVDVSKDVKLAQVGGDVEISVPLEVLGLKPVAGRDIRADFGLLRGDGAQTVQRMYWNNLNTLIVSDIPSEARLQPGNWGIWRFRSPVSATILPAVTSAGVQPGVSYAYHKGKWEKLPDFKTLKPTVTGVVPRVQLQEAVTDREYFALEYNGFIRIPADGVWCFSLATDGGQRLWIGDTLVVDSDADRYPKVDFEMIRLAAGLHRLRINYLHANQDGRLDFRWSGPGVQDQAVPASAFGYKP